MGEPTEKYIKSVIEQIRSKKARDNIADELLNHINEQKQDYIDCGMEEKEAEEKAVIDMGDPIDVGVNLDKIHRPKPQYNLILAVILIMIVGIAIQYFCYGVITDHYVYGDSYTQYHFQRMILGCLIGLFCMITVYFIDYTVIFKKPKILYTILTIGIVFAILTLNISPLLSGTYSGLYPQLVIITVPVIGSIVYRMKNQGIVGFLKFALISIFAILCCCIILNISVAVYVAFGLFFIFILIMKDNWLQLKKTEKIAIISFCIILALIFIGIIFKSAYRLKRVEMLFDYESDKYGFGYQIWILKSIVSACNNFGAGNPIMLDGKEFSFNYFPYIENSNEFLMFMYRFGKVPAIILALLIISFIILITTRSFKEKNKMGRFIAVGISGIFICKILFYFMNNLGYYLIEAQFPFMSYGKVYMVVNGILMGILLSIFRNTNVVSEKNTFSDRKYNNDSFFNRFLKVYDDEYIEYNDIYEEAYEKGYKKGYTDGNLSLDSNDKRWFIIDNGRIIINFKNHE